MRRMFSEKQIQEISKLIAEGRIEELAVRKIPAPKSTTLTDEQVEMIIDGVFIEGVFDGQNNPVLFPAYDATTYYKGLYITDATIGAYTINKGTNKFSRNSAATKLTALNSIASFNGKAIPDYPASEGTFVLKCVDGVLTWVEEA